MQMKLAYSFIWTLILLLPVESFAASCSKEDENKTHCIAAEKMKCVKKFNSSTNGFIYQIEAVTSSTTISTDSPLYKRRMAILRYLVKKNLQNHQRNRDIATYRALPTVLGRSMYTM